MMRQRLRFPNKARQLEKYFVDHDDIAAASTIAETPTESFDELWWEALTTMLDDGFPPEQLHEFEALQSEASRHQRANEYLARFLGILRGRKWRITRVPTNTGHAPRRLRTGSTKGQR